MVILIKTSYNTVRIYAARAHLCQLTQKVCKVYVPYFKHQLPRLLRFLFYRLLITHSVIGEVRDCPAEDTLTLKSVKYWKDLKVRRKIKEEEFKLKKKVWKSHILFRSEDPSHSSSFSIYMVITIIMMDIHDTSWSWHVVIYLFLGFLLRHFPIEAS